MGSKTAVGGWPRIRPRFDQYSEGLRHWRMTLSLRWVVASGVHDIGLFLKAFLMLDASERMLACGFVV